MPHRPLQGIPILVLVLIQALAGCSQQPLSSAGPRTGEEYCLRAGKEQTFDCSAPLLRVQDVRDPLAPEHRFSDEELMSLLAEAKRWLARRKLALQGADMPPEPSLSPAPTSPSEQPSALLPRPWALILNDFSPHALQRNNYAQH